MRDVSVRRDIYALWTEGGTPDLSIETELLDKSVENGFPDLIALLESGKEPSYWGWRSLSRFMAFQLLRTPRSSGRAVAYSARVCTLDRRIPKALRAVSNSSTPPMAALMSSALQSNISG
ncbi:MAG: hypothetical protein DMG57_34685 [Acidobacteria bacterium]|nr:MAG: hypothetical protein DMG57_34685 [Acidobacteriota bacterium]